MRHTPEEIHELTSKILELKRKLAEAMREWERMFPDDGNPPAPLIPSAMTKTGQLRPQVFESSEAGKILEYINHAPSQEFHPRDLALDLGVQLQTVRATLSRLVKRGLVEKRSFGKYGALTPTEKEAPSEEKTS
jgi:DNA-binding transcriptional ArsR family regulator